MTYEPTSTGVGVCPERRQRARDDVDRAAARGLTLRVDAFTRETIEQESRQLGVSPEELANFAVLYYLADRDSGRIARRPPRRRDGEQRSDPHAHR